MRFSFTEPIIYLITRGDAADSNFTHWQREIIEIVRIAVEEKIALIQIRETRLSGLALFQLTTSVAEITRGSMTRVLVNDRADIALAAGADGVHLASHSLPVSVIRKNFPSKFIIGVSTHSSGEIINSANDGADFAVFGPVFETPGKSKPQGLKGLSEVCSELKHFPVIGLGGIDESNFESVIAAGAKGIAAIRALNQPETMRSISAKMRRYRAEAG